MGSNPHPTTGLVTAVAACSAAAAGCAVSAVIAGQQFWRYPTAAGPDQLVHWCLAVVATALAALCAHLALSWLLIAVVRASGPQSLLGRFSLGALRVIAPRLVRTAVTASAAAASIAALGSTAAFAQTSGTSLAESTAHTAQSSPATVQVTQTPLGWGTEPADPVDAPGSDGGGSSSAPDAESATGGAAPQQADSEPSDGEVRIGWDSPDEAAPPVDSEAPADDGSRPAHAAKSATGGSQQESGAQSKPDAELGSTATAVGSAVQGGQYTVRPGDSLWAIAAETLGANADTAEINALVRAIAQEQANHIHNPDLILPGQVLIIPTIDGSAPARS